MPQLSDRRQLVTQQLAEQGIDLSTYVLDARHDGVGWREIERDLRALGITVSHRSLRRWHPQTKLGRQPKRPAA